MLVNMERQLSWTIDSSNLPHQYSVSLCCFYFWLPLRKLTQNFNECLKAIFKACTSPQKVLYILHYSILIFLPKTAMTSSQRSRIRIYTFRALFVSRFFFIKPWFFLIPSLTVFCWTGDDRRWCILVAVFVFWILQHRPLDLTSCILQCWCLQCMPLICL